MIFKQPKGGPPKLSFGAHSPDTGRACWMEALSIEAKEEFSSYPDCVHPCIATIGQTFNDALPDRKRREVIAPIYFEPLGTAGCPYELLEDVGTRWLQGLPVNPSVTVAAAVRAMVKRGRYDDVAALILCMCTVAKQWLADRDLVDAADPENTVTLGDWEPEVEPSCDRPAVTRARPLNYRRAAAGELAKATR